VLGGHKKSFGKNKGTKPFETEELKFLEGESRVPGGNKKPFGEKWMRPFDV